MKRARVTERKSMLIFHNLSNEGLDYSFPCDERGFVLLSELSPEQHGCYLDCLFGSYAGDRIRQEPTIYDYEVDYDRPIES